MGANLQWIQKLHPLNVMKTDLVNGRSRRKAVAGGPPVPALALVPHLRRRKQKGRNERRRRSTAERNQRSRTIVIGNSPELMCLLLLKS